VINVTLIKARSIQALVLREDSIMKWPIFKANASTLAVKRGSGMAIDLPVYQNDVLHALTETGGLPGSDAGDEVWVLHGAQAGIHFHPARYPQITVDLTFAVAHLQRECRFFVGETELLRFRPH